MNDIICNVEAAYRYNTDLTSKEVGKTLRRGMSKAMRKLVKEARANLRARVKNPNRKNPKFNDTLISGVRSSKVYTDKTDGSVYAFGKISKRKNSGSGVYRLLFLEAGTEVRQTRKTHANRGSVGAKWFFKDAVDANQTYFENNMISAINEAIDKINASR